LSWWSVALKTAQQKFCDIALFLFFAPNVRKKEKGNFARICVVRRSTSKKVCPLHVLSAWQECASGKQLRGERKGLRKALFLLSLPNRREKKKAFLRTAAKTPFLSPRTPLSVPKTQNTLWDKCVFGTWRF